MEKKIVRVYTVEGAMKAEMIRMFLEANGIECMVAQDSGGSGYPLTVGRMSEARIFVTEDQAGEAKTLLDAMERGDLELPDDELPSRQDKVDEDQ